MAHIKRTILILLVVFGLAGFTIAQELVTLSVPVVKTSTSSCALDYLTLDVGNSRILVVLKCNNADVIQKVYDDTTTPKGAALLTNLNRGNFSTNSLIKAVYNRLIQDSVITGSISGTPQ